MVENKQKIALVIGGSGGIGSEIAKSLAGLGYQVCVSYCSDRKNAEKLPSGISSEKVSYYHLNLMNEKSVIAAMEKIFTRHSLIDVVVFGPTLEIHNKPVRLAKWEDYSRHLDLQVRGMFFIVRGLLPQIQLKYKTKFIVLLTEYCLGKPPAGLSDYITAKYGLMGFVKTMAVELAKYGATFNMVSPGLTKTKLLANIPPKFIEMATLTNPLQRIASPKDVAEVIAFLASDGSDYLNGVHITVNGGGVMV